MSNRSLSPDELQDRLIRFGVSVCRSLQASPIDSVNRYFTGQLLRSSTAPGAHYSEAIDAESRRDFIHKMKLGLKELRESLVWLKYKKALSRQRELDDTLMKECRELIAIFVASLKTARG
jgi:four helix bundle protein